MPKGVEHLVLLALVTPLPIPGDLIFDAESPWQIKAQWLAQDSIARAA